METSLVALCGHMALSSFPVPCVTIRCRVHTNWCNVKVREWKCAGHYTQAISITQLGGIIDCMSPIMSVVRHICQSTLSMLLPPAVILTHSASALHYAHRAVQQDLCLLHHKSMMSFDIYWICCCYQAPWCSS